MKVFTSARDRNKALLAVVVFAASLTLGYFALRQYAPFVFDATELRAWIRQFGPLAPLVFIVAQTVQVIVAPVPGQVMALVGGYLFGSVAGTIYSMIGVIIGSAIAFSIARRWGRPAVERMIQDEIIERFDGFVETIGVPGLLLFVFIPGLPDDAICFLAGLTRFRLVTFLAVILVGRSPAYIITTFAGDGLATGRVVEGILAVGTLILLSVLAYHRREDIKRYVGGTG
jgi:uncharacterized membrane protein YdjX (TVP38/TMEM64 family)